MILIYLYPNFCTSNDFEQLTAIQTTGGIFSSDPEISIDPSTGTVDITQSTVGGPYTIKYVTQGTCPDSSEVQITIYEDVTADAGPDQTLVLTDQTNLAATSLNVYDTGTWSFITGGGNITDVNDPTTLVSALEDGTNEFMWMVSNPGCLSKIDTVAITVSEF